MAVPAGAGAVAVGQREMLLQITLLSDTLSNIYNTKLQKKKISLRLMYGRSGLAIYTHDQHKQRSIYQLDN